MTVPVDTTVLINITPGHNMANIPETPTYTPGVYLLETSDYVLGGSTGVSNQQAKDLANRTAYLKQTADSQGITVSGLSTAVSTLTDRVDDLEVAVDANTTLIAQKANIASPTFTGSPAAPTATVGTNSTVLATTAFVTTADNNLQSTINSGLALKANIASPALTGTPTAPTATVGTNTTQIATTAFVTSAMAGLGSGYIAKAGLQEMNAGSNLGVNTLTGRTAQTKLTLDVVPTDSTQTGTVGVPNTGPKLTIDSAAGVQGDAALTLLGKVGDTLVKAGSNGVTTGLTGAFYTTRGAGSPTVTADFVAQSGANRRYDIASSDNMMGIRVYANATSGTPVYAMSVLITGAANTVGNIGIQTAAGSNSSLTVDSLDGASKNAARFNGQVILAKAPTNPIQPILDFYDGTNDYYLQLGNTGTLNFINTSAVITGTLSQTGNLAVFGTLTASNFNQFGTFSPTVSGDTTAGTASYTRQIGRWSRAGNLLSVEGRITYSAASGSGALLIGNLPMGSVIETVANSYAAYGDCVINLDTTYNNIRTGINYGTTSNTAMYILHKPVTGAPAQLTVANAPAADIFFSITYRIA